MQMYDIFLSEWYYMFINLMHISPSLCFSWLWVSLASLQQVSVASLQQVSPLARFNRFIGFVLSGVLQNSFASIHEEPSMRVSTGTMQMQNVIPNICLNNFFRKLRKQLDMVVQWFSTYLYCWPYLCHCG